MSGTELSSWQAQLERALELAWKRKCKDSVRNLSQWLIALKMADTSPPTERIER